jgi:hypothetical protein
MDILVRCSHGCRWSTIYRYRNFPDLVKFRLQRPSIPQDWFISSYVQDNMQLSILAIDYCGIPNGKP